MASFADNAEFMAKLPQHSVRCLWSGVTWLFALTVRTFCCCLLSKSTQVSNVKVRKVASKHFTVLWKTQKKNSSWIDPVTFQVQVLDVDKHEATWQTVSKTDSRSAVVTSLLKNEEEKDGIGKNVNGSLHPDTRYLVRVRMRRKNGVGLYSNPVETRTFRLPSSDMGSTGPMNNGQTYTWRQTSQEVTIQFKLPDTMTSKQIRVDYETNSLSIKNIATGEILLQGSTMNKVRRDECVWSRDPDSGVILVELVKFFSMMQAPFSWSCVIKGHPQIDVNCKLTDEDHGDAQATKSEEFEMFHKQMTKRLQTTSAAFK